MTTIYDEVEKFVTEHGTPYTNRMRSIPDGTIEIFELYGKVTLMCYKSDRFVCSASKDGVRPEQNNFIIQQLPKLLCQENMYDYACQELKRLGWHLVETVVNLHLFITKNGKQIVVGEDDKGIITIDFIDVCQSRAGLMRYDKTKGKPLMTIPMNLVEIVKSELY
jgi:hypothetical protein